MMVARLRHRRLIVGMLAFLVLTLLGVAPFGGTPRAEAATAPVNGGGSGFAGLEIQQWQADTARKPYSLSVNYSSQSSGVGRTNFASGLYDYGVSDITYQPYEGNLVSQITSGRCHGAANCFKYVPVSAGGLSFMYNLTIGSSRVSDLKLTPAQVCGIFTQQIKTWKDPSLLSDNAELNNLSGAAPINVVTRSDAAGESFILSQYCISQAPAVWNAFIAYEKTDPTNVGEGAAQLYADQPISDWPSQLSSEGSNTFQESGADGVANAVADPQQGVDAITYDAAGYAAVRSFPVAQVYNAAGIPTLPTEQAVDVALAYAQPDPSTQTFKLDYNGPDPRAYFPSTYSYAVVQTTGEDPSKGSTIAQFLCYAVGKGQTIAPDLRYSRLSAPIVAISVAAITAIPGAPSASDCTAGAPAAPGAVSVAGGASTDTAGGAASGASAGSTGSGETDAQKAAAARLAAAETPTTLTASQKAAKAALEAAQRAAQNGSGGGHGNSSGADALWYLVLGGVVCGIGVGVATSARRNT